MQINIHNMDSKGVSLGVLPLQSWTTIWKLMSQTICWHLGNDEKMCENQTPWFTVYKLRRNDHPMNPYVFDPLILFDLISASECVRGSHKHLSHV